MIDFEKEFRKSKGQPFENNGKSYRLLFTLNTGDHSAFVVKFEQVKGPFRQGIHIESDEPLQVAGKRNNAMLLWQDTASSAVRCHTGTNTTVRVWNIWDPGDRVVHSWHNGAAMIVEAIDEAYWRFQCNDGHPDDACDDLIFTIRLE